jgi:hypothetical protein
MGNDYGAGTAVSMAKGWPTCDNNLKLNSVSYPPTFVAGTPADEHR